MFRKHSILYKALCGIDVQIDLNGNIQGVFLAIANRTHTSSHHSSFVPHVRISSAKTSSSISPHRILRQFKLKQFFKLVKNAHLQSSSVNKNLRFYLLTLGHKQLNIILIQQLRFIKWKHVKKRGNYSSKCNNVVGRAILKAQYNI